MAIIDLPVVGSIAHYDFTTTIGNATYKLELNWNTREQFWYMGVTDANGNVLLAGIKLVLGTFLGRAAHGFSPFKDGVFVCYDSTRKGQEASFDDIGGRVKLRYIPSEDLIARIQSVQAQLRSG